MGGPVFLPCSRKITRPFTYDLNKIPYDDIIEMINREVITLADIEEFSNELKDRVKFIITAILIPINTGFY